MFITKKHIPRRTFLRGCGVTLALPLLESMLPAQTPLRETAAKPVRRFVGVWHPHGASPGYWSPLQEGSNFEFSYITKPLEPFRDRVVLISGLDATGCFSTPEEPGGNHARGANVFSGARPRRDSVFPYLGVTIDQLIAQKYGQDTLLESIQLGVEDPGNNTGNCNWSCLKSSNTSRPLRPGMLMSSTNTSQATLRIRWSTSAAFCASPTIVMSVWSATICWKPRRMMAWSSAITILIMSKSHPMDRRWPIRGKQKGQQPVTNKCALGHGK